jgi:phenylalanyl-tRNA synthetase beta chain
MIQCNRKSVALAGIMGGFDTEITAQTKNLLLESANFEPATIRRCATALGHRTEASARFEKSLDPANTVLAIQRFVHLARPELPELQLTSKLSDAFPNPPAPIIVELDPTFLNRYVGREVPIEQVKSILESMEFEVKDANGKLDVRVPSFRATKDISIEADLIEEVARCIGYGSIEPVLPTVTVRYAEPAIMSRFERQTLTLLCGGMGYAEIHGKIWFDSDWLRTLGFDPGKTVRLNNPAAAGMEQLQTTLVPDLLAAVDLNRHHNPRFELVEIGSVFPPDRTEEPCEDRHLGLAVVAPGRKPAHEDALIRKLKTDLETWLHQHSGKRVTFAAAEPVSPWDHPAKTATLHVDDCEIGRLTAVPAACKRAIDEHLTAWSIALAEINLSALAQMTPDVKKMATVPIYPPVEVDFSVLATAAHRYADIEKELASYDHPLLRRLALVDSYEGGSVPAGQRSFTFRATIADPECTLTEADVQAFRQSFIGHLEAHSLTLRS